MSLNPQDESDRSRLMRLDHGRETIDLDSPDFVVEPLADSPGQQTWLHERLEIARRHLLFILGLTAVSAGLAFYVVHRAPPRYRAVATVRFTDTRSNLTSGVGTDAAQELSYSVDPVKSQMELIASRATAEAAVSAGMLQVRALGSPEATDWLRDVDASKIASTDTMRLRFNDTTASASLGRATASGLYDQPIKVGEVTLTIPQRPEADSALYELSPVESVVSMLQGGLRATRRTETDIADLSFAGVDPHFAQRALNSAVLSLSGLSVKASQKTARARREFLDQQLRKSDSVLDIQRAQLSGFRTASQTLSSKDRMTAEQNSITSINIRREELRADRDVYASLLARARAAKESGDTDRLRTLISAPGISSNPAIMESYQQFAKLKNSRDSLTTGPFPAAPSNPDLVRLNALMQSAGDELIGAVKSQIDGIDARIVALGALGTRSSAEASSLPQTEAEEGRLIQEQEGTQKVAAQLREEQQRAAISEVAQGGQVQIIDLAQLPTDPIKTSPYGKIFLVAFFSLLLAIEFAAIIDGLNKSFRKTIEVENTLRLPTLGAIPKLNGQGKTGPLRISGMRLPSPARSKGTAVVREASTGDSIVDPSAPEFESFRTVRTSLMFSNAVRDLRSILLTSAVPGDGKSTTSANLAAAYAQQGLRVIAIDCDIRKGRLHKLFGVPKTPGIMEVVLGEISLADAVRETSVPNLWLLTCGRNPPNPTELLGSPPVRSILTQLNTDFDLLIIDTPPILATADAAVLGAMVDGVVMVVKVGVTERAVAKRAVERMRATGARIVGTVLNDPTGALSSTEKYYQYQYSYVRDETTS